MAALIFLLIIGIGLFFYARKESKKVLKYIGVGLITLSIVLIIVKQLGWISTDNGSSVETQLSSYNDIIETVSASGKIQPEVEVKISPDVSGEIVALYVNEGDNVSQGELLLKIKPDTYQSIYERSVAALNTSKSSLAKAKAQLIENEANFKRNKILFDNGTISSSEFEKIQASYTIAQLSVEDGQYSVSSAQASVKEARENLNKTNIYAPIDGTISRLNIELGERVVGTAQMAGTELLRLANLNMMEVAVEVNENDINRIHVNDTTIIEVDAYLGQKFKGVVSEIANSANIAGASADQVTNFEVKVRVLSKENFRPGMTATVDIQAQSQKNVVTVPIQSVTTRQDTANPSEKIECVFVYNDGNAELIKVKTGIQDDKNIHILEGLTDSVEIIIGPYSAVSKLLKDGSKVVKQKDKNMSVEISF